MTTDHHATQAWPASAKPQTQAGQTEGDSAGRNRGVQPGKAVKQRTPLAERIWKVLVWGAMVFFLINVLLLIATVIIFTGEVSVRPSAWISSFAVGIGSRVEISSVEIIAARARIRSTGASAAAARK